ncbi:NAD-dependent epimerase/dehydratase family protein [candidate division WOR-3 bacterium]|nr:NAD-dependent epimerase/dehydratase family protein [candidate division WOR-3 bacterium]
MIEDKLLGSRILITGGAGFVGSNLVKKILLSKCFSITVIDNFLSSEKENLPNDTRIKLIEGSCADDQILENLGDEFDHVFHLATFHGNQNSIFDPIADHENNLLTSLKFFKKISDFKKVKMTVYSSAGCTTAAKTYDTPEPTKESDVVSLYMDSPYQISKIAGELYANYFFLNKGLKIVKARFQNVYGPGEILGAGKWRGTISTIWRNVVPVFIYRALKKKPLLLENSGNSSRDFIFVDDIAEGLLKAAILGKSGEVYNLASGVETGIFELAQEINRLCDNQNNIDLLPRRNWDRSGRRFGDIEKSSRDLNFHPKVSLAEGLEKTISWTRENMRIIESCIKKHDKQISVLSN